MVRCNNDETFFPPHKNMKMIRLSTLFSPSYKERQLEYLDRQDAKIRNDKIALKRKALSKTKDPVERQELMEEIWELEGSYELNKLKQDMQNNYRKLMQKQREVRLALPRFQKIRSEHVLYSLLQKEPESSELILEFKQLYETYIQLKSEVNIIYVEAVYGLLTNSRSPFY